MQKLNLLIILMLLMGTSQAMTVSLTTNRSVIDIGQNVLLSMSAYAGNNNYYFRLYNTSGAYITTLQTTNSTWQNSGWIYSPTFQQTIYSTIYRAEPIATGLARYNLSVMDSSTLNVSNASVTIQVNPLPKVSISPYNVSVVSGTRITLASNPRLGTQPYKYGWYNGTCQANRLVSTNTTYTTNLITSTSEYCLIITDNVGEQANAITVLSPVSYLQTASGLVVNNGNNATELFPPDIYTNASGIVATNITTGVVFNISQCRSRRSFLQQSISPNQSILFSNGSQVYTLPIGKPIGLNDTEAGCYVKLLNVSWAPILKTVSYLFYNQSLPMPNFIGNITSSTTSSSTSTIDSTTSIGAIPVYLTSVSTSLSTTTATTTIPANTIKKAQAKPVSLKFNGWYLLGIVIVVVVMLILFGGKVLERLSLR